MESCEKGISASVMLRRMRRQITICCRKDEANKGPRISAALAPWRAVEIIGRDGGRE